MSALLKNLLHFAGLLQSLGLDVPAGRMPDVTEALAHVDLGRRQDVYFTLRSLLVHRQQDLAPFDDAFRVFWRPPPDDWTPNDLRALGEKRRFAPPQIEPAITPSSPAEASLPTLPERIERVAPMSHSPSEVTRLKDFALFTPAEMEEARQAIARFEWSLDTRQTRRWAAGPGPAADLRRVVRANLRYGGELVSIPSRERRIARRPLVLLCDVSGSMERYARILLHFAHGLTRDLDRVEAFLFATRLTRVTHDLASHGVDRALAAVQRSVPDWGGGTRIGDALRSFNLHWARRVLGHGPVVLLISDGWDRGEPAVIRQEMNRLQRSCHRLIWLNPLLGSHDYLPLTRGMQAALPFVDDFLPVHNLVSLEALAERLSERKRTRGKLRIVN